MRTTIRVAAALIAAIAIAGCGQTSTLQDLEGVHAVEPDTVQVYYSPNLFPNVMVACPDGPDGFGYLITTRDYQDPIVFDACPIGRERGDVISGDELGEEGEEGE